VAGTALLLEERPDVRHEVVFGGAAGDGEVDGRRQIDGRDRPIDDRGAVVSMTLKDPDGIALEFYLLRPRA